MHKDSHVWEFSLSTLLFAWQLPAPVLPLPCQSFHPRTSTLSRVSNTLSVPLCCRYNYFSFKVYLFILRDRGRGRERERISSRLHTVSIEPDVGLEPTNFEIMTWAEMESWTLKQLSHPGAPFLKIFLCSYNYLQTHTASHTGYTHAGFLLSLLFKIRIIFTVFLDLLDMTLGSIKISCPFIFFVFPNPDLCILFSHVFFHFLNVF